MRLIVFFLLAFGCCAQTLLVPVACDSYNGNKHNVRYFNATVTGGTGNPLVVNDHFSGGASCGFFTDGIIPPVGQGPTNVDATRPPVPITASSWSGGYETLTIGPTAATILAATPFAVFNNLSTKYPFFNGVFNSVNDPTRVTFGANSDFNSQYPSLVGMWAQPYFTFPNHQAPELVAWAYSDDDGDPVDTSDAHPVIIFDFGSAKTIGYVKQLYNIEVPPNQEGTWLPSAVTFDFSNDGVTFVSPVVHTPTAAEYALSGLVWFNTVINNSVAYRYMRVSMPYFDHAYKSWVMLSKVETFTAGTVGLDGPSVCNQGQTCNISAFGGTAPYTYSLVTGSDTNGSIDSASGVYTAPTHVVPKHLSGGCQVLPNNNIFNTRIDALPVHASSALWLSNMDTSGGIPGVSLGFHVDAVQSTDVTTGANPTIAMNFYYTSAANGNFIFRAFPDRTAEVGGALTAPGFLPSIDNHFLTIYRDTCIEQDNYQLFTTGVIGDGAPEPSANSQAGMLLDLKGNAMAGPGTDAAGLPLIPLLTHQDEYLAAAAGNVDAIQHAARMTLNAASIDTDPAATLWPAQTGTSVPSGCQTGGGGYAWTITGNGTTTITGNAFRTAWASGTALTIGGVGYTVASVGSTSSMTVSATVSSGTHTMTQPASSCPPYGTRFRLKAAYTFPIGSVSGCNTACTNVIAAVVRQQKRYGLILADAASGVWQTMGDGGINSYDIDQARANFTALMGDVSNYEVVDESTLQTSQNQVGTTASWLETKVNNAYVTPDNAAVIKVTDSASETAFFSMALQGIGIGTPQPNEVVMAGAAPFPIQAWITGIDGSYGGTLGTPSFSCSLNVGAVGTLTAGCTYNPPSSVSVVTVDTLTITAAMDTSVTRAISVQIIPVGGDGKLYLGLGKESTSASYAEGGHTWFNDMAQGLSPAISPNDSSLNNGQLWQNASGTNAYVPCTYPATCSSLTYTPVMKGYNDHHVRIHVPNGLVTATMLPANYTSAVNKVGFSFDCNGTIVHATDDLFTFTGGQYVGKPLTCTTVVTDSILHMAVRLQGVNFGSDTADCAISCYSPTDAGYGNLVAGAVVSSSPLIYGTIISGQVSVSGQTVVH